MKVGRGCHLVLAEPVVHLSNRGLRVEDACGLARRKISAPPKINSSVCLTVPLPLSPQRSVIMLHDAARVPSPKDGTNGVAQPVVAATASAAAAAVSGAAAAPGGGPAAVPQASGEEVQQSLEEDEEEEPKAEPVLVKKPHREILDHERKRRVELKCMELQEMMEEQG